MPKIPRCEDDGVLKYCQHTNPSSSQTPRRTTDSGRFDRCLELGLSSAAHKTTQGHIVTQTRYKKKPKPKAFHLHETPLFTALTRSGRRCRSRRRCCPTTRCCPSPRCPRSSSPGGSRCCCCKTNIVSTFGLKFGQKPDDDQRRC